MNSTKINKLAEEIFVNKSSDREKLKKLIKYSSDYLYNKIGKSYLYSHNRHLIKIMVNDIVHDAINKYDASKSKFTTHLLNQGKRLISDFENNSAVLNIPRSQLQKYKKIMNVINEEGLNLDLIADEIEGDKYNLHHIDAISRKTGIHKDEVKKILKNFALLTKISENEELIDMKFNKLDMLEHVFSDNHEKLKIIKAIRELKTTNTNLLAKHLNMNENDVKTHLKEIYNVYNVV